MVDPPKSARRRPGRPAGADSAATREALLRAAVETFAEYGLARTTLRQVADAAGMTTGTLYHHYATKEALFVAAFTWAVDQL
jgi:AcrR family transcriptional regulator